MWCPRPSASVSSRHALFQADEIMPGLHHSSKWAASRLCTAQRAQQASAPLHDLTGLHSLTTQQRVPSQSIAQATAAPACSGCRTTGVPQWAYTYPACLLLLGIKPARDPTTRPQGARLWHPAQTLIYHNASGAMHTLKPTDARSQALGRAQCRPSDWPPRSLDAQPDAALPSSAHAAGAAAQLVAPASPAATRARPAAAVPASRRRRRRPHAHVQQLDRVRGRAGQRGGARQRRLAAHVLRRARQRGHALRGRQLAGHRTRHALQRLRAAPTRASWHGRQLGWISLICSVEQPVSQNQYVLLRMPSRACARPRPETGPIAL